MYIANKYWTFFYKKKNRTEIIFNLGKNKDKRNRHLRFEWSLHSLSFFGFHLYREEDSLTLGLSFIFFSLFITYTGLLRYILKSSEEREWSFSIHHGSIWWNLGCARHQWSRSDGWRQSNLNICDLLFGKIKSEKKNKDYQEHIMKFPEGNYITKMTFEDCYRWRSRIPRFIWEKVVRVAEVKVTPKIPYPGNPLNGFSEMIFPAKNVKSVLDFIYDDIKNKRNGDLNYYNNENRKIVDNYMYTINGLAINIGRVPVEKRNEEWYPLGCSTARIADETFRKLTKKEELFTAAELHFVNKYMGRCNSIDFIQDSTQEELQKEMENYYRTRQQNVSLCAGPQSYSMLKPGAVV